MKKNVAIGLRALIGLSLATFLVYKVITHSGVDLVAEFKLSNPLLLTTALALYGTAILLTVLRWKLLLAVQEIHLPFFRLTQLTMIGVFFNLVLPGAVSGDLVKMHYISPHSKDKTTEAVLTIFLDRVIGLFGLFLVALVFVFLSFKFLLSASRAIQMSAVVVGAGSISAMLGWLSVEFRKYLQRLPGVNGLIRSMRKFTPIKIRDIFDRFILALDIYREHRLVIARSIILSMVVHLCLGLAVFCIGRGFHENNLSPKHYLLTTQVANTIGAVPMTPGGIGSRDFAFKEFLTDGGADSSKAGIIPVFYSILLAIWSLIGGFFYIFLNRK